MLIVALVLAVIGLAALVAAVVTSNELIAWVCIGASVIGVLLLIVDAVRERSRGGDGDADSERDDDTQVIAPVEEYPDEPATEHIEAAEAAEATEVGEGHEAESETETVAVPTDNGSGGDDSGDSKRN